MRDNERMKKQAGTYFYRAKNIVAAVLFAFVCALAVGCGVDFGIDTSAQTQWPENRSTALTAEDIPAYAGDAIIEINHNVPDFSEEELTLAQGAELYGDLDWRGRVTEALACVGPETMPTEERGDISDIHPTGWHQEFYKYTDADYLVSRSHMIAFCLSAEDANVQNLFTGTHCLNTQWMVQYEEKMARYIDKTGNHILYFVDPIFDGDDLMATGVHMKARSVEDDGRGISFNIFIYNVEPGVTIDYATGKSRETRGTTQGSF